MGGLFVQITHKFPERRTLVAEACAVLAGFVKVCAAHPSHLPAAMLNELTACRLQPELRSSLILSIAQQLLVCERSVCM